MNSVKKILFLRNMSLNIKKILKDFCKKQNPNFYVKLPSSLKKEFEGQYKLSEFYKRSTTGIGSDKLATLIWVKDFAKLNFFAKAIFQQILEEDYRMTWEFVDNVKTRTNNYVFKAKPGTVPSETGKKIFSRVEETFRGWKSESVRGDGNCLPAALGVLLGVKIPKKTLINLAKNHMKGVDLEKLKQEMGFDMLPPEQQEIVLTGINPVYELQTNPNNLSETWLQIFCNAFRISIVTFTFKYGGEFGYQKIKPNIKIDTTNIPVYYLLNAAGHWYPLIPPTGVFSSDEFDQSPATTMLSVGDETIDRMYTTGALKNASSYIQDLDFRPFGFGGEFFDTTFTPSLDYADAFCNAWVGDNLKLAKMLGESRIGQSPGDGGEKEDEDEENCDDIDVLTEKLVKKCCVNSLDPTNQESLVIDKDQREEGLKYSYLISYVLEHDGKKYINCFNLIYLRQALSMAKKNKEPLQVILTKNREDQALTFIPTKVTLSEAQVQKAQSQWESLIQTDKENLSKYVEEQYGNKDKAFTNLSSWWYMEQEKPPYVKIVSQSTPYPDFLAVHIISKDDYAKLIKDVGQAATDNGHDAADVINDIENGFHDTQNRRRFLRGKSLYQWIVDASKWTISFPATRILQSYPAIGGFKYVGVNNNILSNGVDYSPYQLLQTINEKFEKNLLLKKVEGEWILDLRWPKPETKNSNAAHIQQLQGMLKTVSGPMKATLEKRLKDLQSTGKITKNNSLDAFNEICNVSLPQDMRGLDLQTYVDLMCQGINPIENANNVIFDYSIWQSLYSVMVYRLRAAEDGLTYEEQTFDMVNVHQVLAEAEDGEYEGSEPDMVPRSAVRLINDSVEEAEAFVENVKLNPNIYENTTNYCYFILYSILAQAITNIN